MNSTLAILAVLDGISYAALVFLVSVGLSLIFGVLRVVNVAHGSFYAFGAYLAATFSLIVSPVSPWLTYPALLAASIVIGVLCGGFVERFLLRPVYGRDDVLQLLITFAVFMIMDNLQRLMSGNGQVVAEIAAPLEDLCKRCGRCRRSSASADRCRGAFSTRAFCRARRRPCGG